MRASIAVLPGDGIGPDVVAESIKVLHAISDRFGHEFSLQTAEIGGGSIDKYGDPLPVKRLRSATIPTRYFSAQSEGQNGMIRQTTSDQKTVYWQSENLLGSLPTYAL